MESPALAVLLGAVDFAKPLTHALAVLQQTLERQGLAPTSAIGLQAYQQVCQEYIDRARVKQQPSPAVRPSKTISVAQLARPDVNAFAHKQQALLKLVKRTYLRRLLFLSKMDEQSVRRQDNRARKALRVETAKFHFRLHIASKLFEALRLTQAEAREKELRADRLLESKGEAVLEEYFLAWRDEALMSQAERALRKEVEAKSELLAKAIFLKRLRTARRANSDQQQRHEDHKDELASSIQLHSIRAFFRLLANNTKTTHSFAFKLGELSLMRRRQALTSLAKTIKKVIIYRAIAEERREKIVQKLLYPRVLMRKMRTAVEVRKAYFRNKQKLIPLWMLLEAIKQGLLRQGYEQTWMEDLQQSVEFTDRKLGFPLRRHLLSKAFSAFRQQLAQERECIELIRMPHGQAVLKQLIYNYKLSIIKQKEQHRIEKLQSLLVANMAATTLLALQQLLSQRKSEELLTAYLMLNRAKQTICSMRKSHRSSQAFASRLLAFKEKREREHLRMVFAGFQGVTMTERVNGRLVEQFQRYTSQLMVERIFEFLKGHCFSEQLVKRRQHNVRRIRLGRYADALFFNLKVDLYAHTKATLALIARNALKLRKMRTATALQRIAGRFRGRQMQLRIGGQVDEEYRVRFKWKIFNLFKVIAQRRRAEKATASIIAQSQARKVKEKVLDRMLTRLLLSLLLKRINASIQKKLLSAAWSQLQRQEVRMSSIREDNDEASFGVELTSEFRLGSPSLEFSPDLDGAM